MIVNYHLTFEKNLLASEIILVNGITSIHAGTINDKLAGGINMMAGHFTNPFQQQETKKISYYIYGQAIGSLVGYDASLQGGLFTR